MNLTHSTRTVDSHATLVYGIRYFTLQTLPEHCPQLERLATIVEKDRGYDKSRVWCVSYA